MNGLDHIIFWPDRHPVVSIHTPMKGVTRSRIEQLNREIVSIHTPMKGVTAQPVLKSRSGGVSIHTPMKGVTEGEISH